MSTKIEKVKSLLTADPRMGRTKLARELGISDGEARRLITIVKKGPVMDVDDGQPAPEVKIEDLIPTAMKILKKNPITPANLAAALGLPVDRVPELLDELTKLHSVDVQGHFLVQETPPFGRIPVEVLNPPGGRIRCGLVADTHLACREERLDALHAVYDLYEREGITQVYHAGNIVDGYVARINGASVWCSTPDDQAYYVLDNYPARDGITTYFVTGDDHEGWWIKEGLNWGAYLTMLAEKEGRTDLQYIGHVEADIEFKGPEGSTIMKVQHPGGGSCYARSYAPQKTIESLTGGEKPAILVQGHYHVSNYMFERNVHVVNLPGFQDQTVFGRKKRLRFEVGGAIVSFTQTDGGSVSRFSCEFLPFFDRGYYKKFLRSDTKLVKGHLTHGRSKN
jgi:predicted phosphodiesterase